MISIIIPVYNNWKYTESCLKFFNKHKNPAFEVVIVDNASTDGTEDGCKIYPVKYIRNNVNTGFGAAVNKGFQNSSGDVIIFLNNDIMFSSDNVDWLSSLEKICRDNRAIVGPTGGLLDKDFNFVYETEDFSKDINYMSGWFLCASRKVFESLIINGNDGPFDAKTFFAYFEDTDLSFRAKEKGIKFIKHSVPVFHIGRQTSKIINLSSMYKESKEKFTKKWKKK